MNGEWGAGCGACGRLWCVVFSDSRLPTPTPEHPRNHLLAHPQLAHFVRGSIAIAADPRRARSSQQSDGTRALRQLDQRLQCFAPLRVVLGVHGRSVQCARPTMPLPKSILCSACRKTYPEGWKRCPYCGFDEVRARQDGRDPEVHAAQAAGVRAADGPEGCAARRRRCTSTASRRESAAAAPQREKGRDGRPQRPPARRQPQRPPQVRPPQQQAAAQPEGERTGRRRRRRRGAGRGEAGAPPAVPHRQQRTASAAAATARASSSASAASETPRSDGAHRVPKVRVDRNGGDVFGVAGRAVVTAADRRADRLLRNRAGLLD